MPQPVNGGGVDPVDAKFENMLHGRERSCVVLRPPGECPVAASNGPRAEADRRDFHSARAQFTFRQTHFHLHKSSMTFPKWLHRMATNIMTRFFGDGCVFCAARQARPAQ